MEIEINEKTYLKLTDKEADELAKQEIINTLWAFTPAFLSDMTELSEKTFEKLSELYEDANEVVLFVVENSCGIDEFVKAAIKSDGRGHFISSYDGKEIEEDGYFLYRTN